MPEPFNPFEHHHGGHDHDHDHGHDHAQAETEPADPAQRSLADALRVTFLVLKVVMLLVVIAYLFSGVFTVKSNEKAVLLRFGRIVGKPGSQVLEKGGPYFAFPFPIDQVVKIPTTQRTVQIIREFYWALPPGMDPAEAIKQPPNVGKLNPEVDSSLITGDGNIVHARFTVNFSVADPVAYLKNVKSPDRAEALVKSVAQQAIVFAVASTPANMIFLGQFDETIANTRAAEVLQRLDAGLAVTIQKGSFQFPISVVDAFQSANRALSEQTSRRSEARSREAQTLGQAAGDAAQPLMDLITRYEDASLRKDKAALARLDAEFKKVFTDMTIDGKAITGEVSVMINQARAQAREEVNAVRAAAKTFNDLLPAYLANPRIFKERQWAQALQTILDKHPEIFVMDGQTYIEINRNSKWQNQKEAERLKSESAPKTP